MLYLVRHGKTAYNAERRLQGQMDIPLCYEGILQAEELSLRLQKEGRSFGALYSSSLQRAKVTAGIIGRRMGIEPITVPGLEEIYFGKFQSHTFAEIAVIYPEEFAAYSADREHCAPHGGETPGQVLERARRTLLSLPEVKRLMAGEEAPDTLVVCHGAVIAYLRAAARGQSLAEITELIPKNAELIPISAGELKLISEYAIK